MPNSNYQPKFQEDGPNYTRYYKSKFKNREAYTKDTKDFLNQIKDNRNRKGEVIKLLVKLYDDLVNSIKIGEKSSGAINDDAIEGILAIADTCIEEQYENKKHRYSIFHDNRKETVPCKKVVSFEKVVKEYEISGKCR